MRVWEVIICYAIASNGGVTDDQLEDSIVLIAIMCECKWHLLGTFHTMILQQNWLAVKDLEYTMQY